VKIIETNRLVIRRMSTDDSAFMLELFNEPSWLRFIGDRGIRTIEDAQHYILNGPVEMYARLGYGFYVVQLKETDWLLKKLGLRFERTVKHPDEEQALELFAINIQ
jgi:hypothetical protein